MVVVVVVVVAAVPAVVVLEPELAAVPEREPVAQGREPVAVILQPLQPDRGRPAIRERLIRVLR